MPSWGKQSLALDIRVLSGTIQAGALWTIQILQLTAPVVLVWVETDDLEQDHRLSGQELGLTDDCSCVAS